MPGMNQVGDTCSFFPNLTFASNAISERFFIFPRYDLQTVGHYLIVGMSNVPFISARRQD